MNLPGGIDSAAGTGLRTAVEGIVWPAIPPDAGAHLLALNFQLERSQWWPPEEMRRRQLAQLRALLAHAVETVPHYQLLPYRDWLKRPDGEAWDAFGGLPHMTRRQVQDAGEALFAAKLPSNHGSISEDETSGSTGMPLRYRTTTVAGFVWSALAMREHFWHRRDFSLRHAFIRGSKGAPLMSTWGPPSNTLFQCGQSANLPVGRTTAEKCDWLSALNPHYLMSTPSTIRSLAGIAMEGRLHLPLLREVRTVGETVSAPLRDMVREAWGVGLTDIYSSSECGLLALQCPQGDGYHLQSEWAVIEVLNVQGKPCLSGQVGHLVVTPLHNFAMPLVRYDTGDFAEVGDACPCGRGLASLRRILGRRRNRLIHPDGGNSWPNLSSLPWVEKAPYLRRFQLLQKRDLTLQLRYESASAFSQDECDRVSSMLLEHLRCNLPLRFEHVAALPLSEAGKLEDFISEIEEVPEVQR